MLENMMDNLNRIKSVYLHAAEMLICSAQTWNAQKVDALCLFFEHLKNHRSNLVFCGIGKSGYVAQKLASTFCSLGLPSYFLHPIDSLHGDLGRVRNNDIFVFISKSGTTEEILKLLPFLAVKKENRIGLLGNTKSLLAKQCGLVLDCSVKKEACLNDQAPTTSIVVALTVGHAMAVLYQGLYGVTKYDFAYNHPGGLLGKSLRLSVKDVMTPEYECAQLSKNKTLKDAILEMGKFPVGGLAVVGVHNKFLGIIVEGDIRRALVKYGIKAMDVSLDLLCNKNSIVATLDLLAIEALTLMEAREKPLNLLPIVEESRFVGFLRLHDLLKEGLQQTPKLRANCSI